MNKLFFFILIFLSLSFSASADDFTIVLNGETTTVTGSMSADGEYIITGSMTYKVTGKNEVILGDLNQDGSLNVMDVTALIDMIVPSNGGYSAIADMNKNSSLDVLDLTKLIDAVIGQIEEIIVLSYIVEEMPDEWIVGGQSYGRVDQG